MRTTPKAVKAVRARTEKRLAEGKWTAAGVSRRSAHRRATWCRSCLAETWRLLDEAVCPETRTAAVEDLWCDRQH